MNIINKLLVAITDHLPCRIINDGNEPYLERFYVCTLFGWRFYLHRFVDSDPNRGLHDHPWQKAYSLILSGWYWEETRYGTRRVEWFNSLTGDTFHRVILPPVVADAGCWTLFFHTAANVKPWGFLKPIADSKNPGSAIFQPYTYSREGSQKDWWLTAPKGRVVRNGGRV